MMDHTIITIKVDDDELKGMYAKRKELFADMINQMKNENPSYDCAPESLEYSNGEIRISFKRNLISSHR